MKLQPSSLSADAEASDKHSPSRFRAEVHTVRNWFRRVARTWSLRSRHTSENARQANGSLQENATFLTARDAIVTKVDASQDPLCSSKGDK
jgi:hypothetical protein